jgi:hypothetical protein
MQLIANYPIDGAALTPYYNQPVVAVTTAGDTIAGVIDCVRDGMLYLKPVGAAQAAAMVQSVKKNMKKHGKSKKSANIKAFGFPGFGFVNPGAAALAFAIPLFLLGALFTFPFFF